MKGDFSKDTFAAKKHFHDVLMQQGRVLLDTDWNEQGSITSYRVETGTKDIIGQSGAPMHDAGFGISVVNSLGSPLTPGSDLEISKGHFYVDGILCENEEDVLFVDQPDYDSTPLPADPGTYIFYLDVWQRHITALENSDIREVALGGPDTTTRSKTVWQVKYTKSLFISPPDTDNCLTALPADVLGITPGALSAKPESGAGSNDPCGIVTSGGYRRLENQLYRVEIHTPGDRGTATFKWSRDNGSVVVKWEGQDSLDPNKLIVNNMGRDELLGFKSGDWVELINDTTDLLAKPGILAELAKAEGNVFTLKQSSIKYPPGITRVEIGTKNPRIRRWDSAGDLKLNIINTWLTLEEGVQVKFEAGIYKTGDYWMIPARTANADVEWPFVVPQPPQGIKHHYAKLAIVNAHVSSPADKHPIWTLISDCRPIFPPVTELTSFCYLSGDGQEAKPDTNLAALLEVGVANGQWPVSGARVKFELIPIGGLLYGSLNYLSEDGTTHTDGAGVTLTSNLITQKGVATCQWKLGNKTSPANQQVKATLLNAAGNAVHLPIIFNAKIIQPALFYVSGDGQRAMPGATLLSSLKVGVSFDQFPVPNANIEFKLLSGGGTLTLVNSGLSNADGIAECNWKLGASGIQQVSAQLLDATSNPIHLPIIFTAGLSVAEDVFYSAKCTNWSTSSPPTTVADALDALCERKNEVGCCSYSVGPQRKDGSKGDYETIDEAITDLQKKSIRDISLCLLPGNHLIERDINMVEDEAKLRTLVITGYGAYIFMKTKMVTLLAQKIVLEGFSLQANDAQNKEDDAQIFLTAEQVKINHCDFTRTGISSLPFIAINNPGVVYLKSNRILAFFSLILANGIQGMIEDNLITYLMLQNESINPFAPLPFSWTKNLKVQIRNDISISPEKFIKTTDWVLNIRGNRIGVLVTDVKRAQPQDIYKNIIITENVFQLNDNSFIAEFINISNNSFLQERTHDLAMLAYVLAYNIIIIGNIGVTRGENVTQEIDTIPLNAIRGQDLNLVHIGV